ncbi:hypothetical protein K1X12_09685 [Hyphomonas sp. WL0036]|uniref:ECF-type sigma factor n=1 Tax=Hyphomonas sediminis TaxID=2866160 RepID=UPI001C7F5610|nr:hypothetical protein [Hyphomonas sediminis]
MSDRTQPDSEEVQRLIASLYPELKRTAAALGRRAGSPETLRSTVLVNEAFLKLRRSSGFVDEKHFLRTAALAMRQILVNHAKARLAARRGGGKLDPLDENMPVYWESDERLVELNEALDQLTEVSPRLAEIVQYRFFAGYSEAETGALMGITDRTVRRDWVKAKAFLLMIMQDGKDGKTGDSDIPL